jgi:hypothetical protein
MKNGNLSQILELSVTCGGRGGKMSGPGDVCAPSRPLTVSSSYKEPEMPAEHSTTTDPPDQFNIGQTSVTNPSPDFIRWGVCLG